jgi:O-antigen ligase
LLFDPSGNPAKANYAHNTLLASLRDGGLIAAGLYLAMLCMALTIASNHYRATGDDRSLTRCGVS